MADDFIDDGWPSHTMHVIIGSVRRRRDHAIRKTVNDRAISDVRVDVGNGLELILTEAGYVTKYSTPTENFRLITSFKSSCALKPKPLTVTPVAIQGHLRVSTIAKIISIPGTAQLDLNTGKRGNQFVWVPLGQRQSARSVWQNLKRKRRR